MSSVPRSGGDALPCSLVGALDHAGCLVVTGMSDHEMREPVQDELASHIPAAAVADDSARALPDRGATDREPRANTSIRPSQVADRLALKLGAMVGNKMHRALGSCGGADQARRRKR